MSDKKVIKWQFNDLFYDLLINQINTIRINLIYKQEYALAFKEMVFMVAGLNYTIKQYDSRILDSMDSRIDKIYGLLKEYDRARYGRRMARHERMRKVSKAEWELSDEITKLYRELMGTIDKMEMIFKKDRRDEPGKAVMNIN